MAQSELNQVTKVGGYATTLEDPDQDFRGRDVYDRDGEQIGSVEGLYVDAEEQELRFLEVGAGRFLGIGEKHFLVPVEVVVGADQDRVTIDQDQEKAKNSPDVPLNPVIEPEHQRKVYDYYGYPYPA